MAEKKSSSRKIGRNKNKASGYASSHVRERNKARKIVRHFHRTKHRDQAAREKFFSLAKLGYVTRRLEERMIALVNAQ